MLLSKIIRFKNIHEGSHYYFEKAVNDALGDIQRIGGYIMSVWFERHFDRFDEPSKKEDPGENSGSGEYFYAYILFNNSRHTKGPIEDRSKPVLAVSVFEPGVVEGIRKAQERADVTKYRGVDMTDAPPELQAIAERLITGKSVPRIEYEQLEEYITEKKLP